jgi:hypothetical protein
LSPFSGAALQKISVPWPLVTSMSTQDVVTGFVGVAWILAFARTKKNHAFVHGFFLL